MRGAILLCALSGCYLSHPPPEAEEQVPDAVDPPEEGPCVIVQGECEPARAVHRDAACPWAPEACVSDGDDSGEWCCMDSPSSQRAVEVDGECRFDTVACLAFSDGSLLVVL